jgi:hypothetical protein
MNTPEYVKLLNASYQLLAKGSKNQNADSIPYAQCFMESLNMLMDHCHNQAKAMGWHDTPREDGTMIALIHSELSEALEGLRKGRSDEHLPHRLNAEVELADAIIRIMDFAGLKGYDIGGAVIEKLEYNRHRADHKPENRAKDGGKKW